MKKTLLVLVVLGLVIIAGCAVKKTGKAGESAGTGYSALDARNVETEPIPSNPKLAQYDDNEKYAWDPPKDDECYYRQQCMAVECTTSDGKKGACKDIAIRIYDITPGFLNALKIPTPKQVIDNILNGVEMALPSPPDNQIVGCSCIAGMVATSEDTSPDVAYAHLCDDACTAECFKDGQKGQCTLFGPREIGPSDEPFVFDMSEVKYRTDAEGNRVPYIDSRCDCVIGKSQEQTIEEPPVGTEPSEPPSPDEPPTAGGDIEEPPIVEETPPIVSPTSPTPAGGGSQYPAGWTDDDEDGYMNAVLNGGYTGTREDWQKQGSS